jgi:hypothetical protein
VGRTGNSELFGKKLAKKLIIIMAFRKTPAKTFCAKLRRRSKMNKLLILGLPIAKSALYERQSAITKSLKSKIFKRNNQTMSCIPSLRQNMHLDQSNGTSTVAKRLTAPVKKSREEFLFISESSMVKSS